MKPKLFIGSSVEGLNIAYAVQQNLTHNVESTVWDQGVFELSQTTIESLADTLETMDFGVFVFSPDDITILRGNSSSTVRDNVLFELGLFIGKLGRERVFFLMPDGSDMHISTDLLGVTPGKYESNRQDNSYQAATGAACNQIRMQVAKLGCLHAVDEYEVASESTVKENPDIDDWHQDILDNDFTSAKIKLKKLLSIHDNKDIYLHDAWLTYITYKEKPEEGAEKFNSLADKYEGSIDIQRIIPRMLNWDNNSELAVSFVNKSIEKHPNESIFRVVKSESLKKEGDIEGAIECLSEFEPINHPDIAIALSNIYIDDEEHELALNTLHESYLENPRHSKLLDSYAKLLHKEGKLNEALYLQHLLTLDNPKNPSYWGYLSNVSLDLDLYDTALTSCKRANELANSEESWLLYNIGNILNNKGFYEEAISWLNKGLEVSNSSEYAHDRLSKAIKSKSDEEELFKKLCIKGRKSLKSYTPEFDAD